LFGGIVRLGAKRLSPPQQQRARNAVSSCNRYDLARRLQALYDDLELLILGPASPAARLHHFQPSDLGTVLITVHKESSQHRASTDKAAGGIHSSNMCAVLMSRKIKRAVWQNERCREI
jgi:hypothetical protein